MPPQKQAVVSRGSFDSISQMYADEGVLHGVGGSPGILTPQEAKAVNLQIGVDLERLSCSLKKSDEDTQQFNQAWQSTVGATQNDVYTQGDLIANSLLGLRIGQLAALGKLDDKEAEGFKFDPEKPLKRFSLRSLDDKNRPMGITFIWHPEAPQKIFSICIAKDVRNPDVAKREALIITPPNIHEKLKEGSAKPETSATLSNRKSQQSIQTDLISFCADAHRVQSLLPAFFTKSGDIDFAILNDLADSYKLISNPSQTALNPSTLVQFARHFAPITRKLHETRAISDTEREKADSLQDKLKATLAPILTNNDPKLLNDIQTAIQSLQNRNSLSLAAISLLEKNPSLFCAVATAFDAYDQNKGIFRAISDWFGSSNGNHASITALKSLLTTNKEISIEDIQKCFANNPTKKDSESDKARKSIEAAIKNQPSIPSNIQSNSSKTVLNQLSGLPQATTNVTAKPPSSSSVSPETVRKPLAAEHQEPLSRLERLSNHPNTGPRQGG